MVYKPDCQLWVDHGGGGPQISEPQQDHGPHLAQYDELSGKNREDLNTYWSQQTAETGAAENALMELRHTVQSLEIDLDSMRNLKSSLENSLREVEMHYSMQVEQLNRILLDLKSELAQTWAEWQHQA